MTSKFADAMPAVQQQETLHLNGQDTMKQFRWDLKRVYLTYNLFHYEVHVLITYPNIGGKTDNENLLKNTNKIS